MKNQTDITNPAPHASPDHEDRDELLGQALSVAVHAAGHAVVSLVAGAPFDRVTIRHDPASTWTGCPSPPPGLMPRSGSWQDDAPLILGGPLAQLEHLTRTGTGDRASNIAAIRAMHRDEFDDIAALNVNEYHAELRAAAIIRHWWEPLMTLAKAILEEPDTTLTHAQCDALIGARTTGIDTPAHQRHVQAVQRQYARGLEYLCPRVLPACVQVAAPAEFWELDIAA